MWTLHASDDQIARTRVFKRNRSPEKLELDERQKEQIADLLRRGGHRISECRPRRHSADLGRAT